MEAYLPQIISFVLGVVVPALLHRFGVKVPVIVPDTSVAPGAKPAVDVPAVASALTDAVEWVLRARSGQFAVTDADKKALATFRQLADEIIGAK